MTRHHIIVYARRQKHPTTLATPIAWISTCLHPPMKCRMGPVRNYRYIAMFNRVEVHVVQMARIISLVPNSMLPKTSLPDATLHPQRARQGHSPGPGFHPSPFVSMNALPLAAVPVQNEFSLL